MFENFPHKLAVIPREYADWGSNKYANLGCYICDMLLHGYFAIK